MNRVFLQSSCPLCWCLPLCSELIEYLRSSGGGLLRPLKSRPRLLPRPLQYLPVCNVHVMWGVGLLQCLLSWRLSCIMQRGILYSPLPLQHAYIWIQEGYSEVSSHSGVCVGKFCPEVTHEDQLPHNSDLHWIHFRTDIDLGLSMHVPFMFSNCILMDSGEILRSSDSLWYSQKSVSRNVWQSEIRGG